MYRIIDTNRICLDDGLDYEGVWKWIESHNRYTDIRVQPYYVTYEQYHFGEEMTVSGFALSHSGKASVAKSN